MSAASAANAGNSTKVWFIRFLLFIAGLGGLLFGIDVGIINGVLPYLKDTSPYLSMHRNFPRHRGGVFLRQRHHACLFAGSFADLIGRKTPHGASAGLLFVVSILMRSPCRTTYWALAAGRIRQGISGGLIAVVVPLYLAGTACRPRRLARGRAYSNGCLPLGFVVVTLIARYFSGGLDGIEKLGDYEKLLAAKDIGMGAAHFAQWVPGILFLRSEVSS